MLPFNYAYSVTVEKKFEIPGASQREKGRGLSMQCPLNTELALYSGYRCVRGICACVGIRSGGQSWGSRGTW